jgi:hypothetical protein
MVREQRSAARPLIPHGDPSWSRSGRVVDALIWGAALARVNDVDSRAIVTQIGVSELAAGFGAVARIWEARRMKSTNDGLRFILELGVLISLAYWAQRPDLACVLALNAHRHQALVQRRVFATRFEPEIAVVEYLGWFNHTCLAPTPLR